MLVHKHQKQENTREFLKTVGNKFEWIFRLKGRPQQYKNI